MEMSKTLNWVFVISLSLLMSCSGMFGGGKDKIRKVEQNKFAPPGTVWVRDNIFIDIFEISNENWHEYYLSVLENNNGKSAELDFNKILPDDVFPTDSSMIGSTTSTTGLGSKKSKNNFFNVYYHHYYFAHYPVIKLTKEKAVNFCDWRTKVVNSYFAVEMGELDEMEYVPDHIYKDVKQRVVYRLPTKSEWEEAAGAGLDGTKFPFGYEEIKQKNGKYKFGLDNAIFFEYDEEKHKNLHLRAPSLNGKKVIPPTYPVSYGKPNKYGVYNMPGNVSEMIDDDGVVKGLSWADEIREYYHDEDIEFKRPSMMVGFRCVCETTELYNK